MDDLTGRQFGLYQIVTPLGEGGMAAVYKAYQPSVDRYVAIKVLPRHFANDPQFIKRFEQEARVLAKLQHPHILPIHDYGEADGYTYMVMPLVAGGDLSELIKSKSLALAEIGQIISQVGDALDYAHTQGVVHRDVKPSNILIDTRGNCLLTDFGIAKLVQGASNLTSSGNIIGTPSYMSPEQGLGQPLDGRSDIYALGIILYEMVTGRAPFKAETPMAVVIKHIQEPLPPPSKVDPNVPEAVERVILKTLAKKPEDRYATPGDMVKALQSAIQAGLSLQPAADMTLAKDTGATHRVSSGPIRRVQPKSPAAVKQGPRQAQPGQMMLWSIAGILLVFVMGLALLGVWWLSRPVGAVETPPTVPVESPPTAQPRLELPRATPTLASQSHPTQTPVVPPTPPPTAKPAQQPPPTQPPADPSSPPSSGPPQSPPPEAIEACRGAGEGTACSFTSPRGAVNGICRPAPAQLACIPRK